MAHRQSRVGSTQHGQHRKIRGWELFQIIAEHFRIDRFFRSGIFNQQIIAIREACIIGVYSV